MAPLKAGNSMSSGNLRTTSKKRLAYLDFSVLIILTACSTHSVQLTPTTQPSITRLAPIAIPATVTSTVAPTETLLHECWTVKPITEANTKVRGSFVYYDENLKLT